jgi:hypothetical protein
MLKKLKNWLFYNIAINTRIINLYLKFILKKEYEIRYFIIEYYVAIKIK